MLLMCAGAMAFVRYSGADEPTPVPKSKQRMGGDPARGYNYLVNGDYVRSGIPLKYFQLGMAKDRDNLLQRTGINETIPYPYTAIKVSGETLVAPNCLQCHAQVFDDQLIIGLGNSEADFTKSQKLNPQAIKFLDALIQKTSPKLHELALPFLTTARTIAPWLYADVRGVNTADRLAALLVAHRNPKDFTWSDEALMSVSEQVIPSDTPPWWLLKKKNAMFYNGFGRGDFGRFLMASNLLTVNDTSESRQVDEHMPDLLAYIYSLQPPKYPKAIDADLAARGRKIFEQNCSSCHGTYGSHSTYPNLLIPESLVQTDSLLYSANYSNPQFVNWFNRSWFTEGDHPARLVPYSGYIAPPLDGIWITAPYLHNGSVPTLEALLNSKLRPEYWSRDFDHREYDYATMGWTYATKEKPGTGIYNTHLPGYGNQGHTFGDDLTEGERKAVIEYLKTL
jgi:hypothetical protein